MSNLNLATTKNSEAVSDIYSQQECSQASNKLSGITELSEHQLESISGGTKWTYKYRRNGQLKKVVIED